MTTQDAVDLLLVLQDKYGAPDVDEEEAVDFLNMATYEWLNRLFPSSLGGIVNFDFDSNTLSNVKALLYKIESTQNSSGVVTNGAITTALQTAGAETGATWYRIGSVGVRIGGVTYPAKYTKHNNLRVLERNFFKKGLSTRPRFIIRQDGLKFYPTDSVNPVSMTVIKHPRLLSLTGPVNPQLDDAQMYNIIAIALKLAGVATRDEELITLDVRNTLQTMK